MADDPIPGPTGDAGRARRRRRHARGQPRRVGRGGRALRGLVRRGRRADPVRRDQPVRRRDRAHRRPPRPLPARDPPPVRGWARHAVALEPRGGRGRRRRLQPAHARARGAADRGHRRARALDPGRRARHAGRAGRHGRSRLHRSRLAHLARRPRRVGGGHRPAPVTDRPLRPVRGPPGRVAVRRRRGRSLDRDRLRLLRAAPRRRAAGRPSTSTGCRSTTPTRAGSSPAPGPSARSSRRCSARICGSSASPSTRSTGGAATATSGPRSAAGSRCRSP